MAWRHETSVISFTVQPLFLVSRTAASLPNAVPSPLKTGDPPSRPPGISFDVPSTTMCPLPVPSRLAQATLLLLVTGTKRDLEEAVLDNNVLDDELGDLLFEIRLIQPVDLIFIQKLVGSQTCCLSDPVLILLRQ